MGTLGFEDYVDPLKHYLHKFREIEGERAAATSTSTSTTPDMPRNNNNATGYADAPGGMMMMGLGSSLGEVHGNASVFSKLGC